MQSFILFCLTSVFATLLVNAVPIPQLDTVTGIVGNLPVVGGVVEAVTGLAGGLTGGVGGELLKRNPRPQLAGLTGVTSALPLLGSITSDPIDILGEVTGIVSGGDSGLLKRDPQAAGILGLDVAGIPGELLDTAGLGSVGSIINGAVTQVEGLAGGL